MIVEPAEASRNWIVWKTGVRTPGTDMTEVRKQRKDKHTDTQKNWTRKTGLSDGASSATLNLSGFIVHS